MMEGLLGMAMAMPRDGLLGNVRDMHVAPVRSFLFAVPPSTHLASATQCQLGKSLARH